jgi:tRNA dimethylallyltransferase
MRAIGVREITSYLIGERSLDDAIASGQQSTRRYAKRQYTWFAHQPPADWPRFQQALDVTNLREALAVLQPKS